MRTLLFFLTIALALGVGAAFGQTDKALLHQLAEENKKSVEALALYPEDTRLAILESAKYPEVLIKMKNAQEKTSAAFRTLIEDYPRNTQNVFFDLTRYPALVADLVVLRNDRTAMRQALDVLPENKRDEAFGVADRQMNTLAKIDDLQRTAQGVFEDLIASYPAPAQAAFRKLLDLPEVVDILNDDLRFTVLVGDVYKDDPAWVIQKVDSLNLAVAREHAEELDNWKAGIDKDPQARSEFQAAANEYAKEYGYTDEIYDTGNDDLYNGYDAEPAVVERYYSYHYPYWFGYPWWAPEPCWRPYPYWWYWGFYPYHQTVIIVHLPSYHFMHWYFERPHHHQVYNHLSTHFVNHYYGHRNSGTTISMGVGEWREQNRKIISDEWLSDRTRLPERLREYATFEKGREDYNARNPGHTETREQYLERNPKLYPDLQRSRTQAQVEIQRESTEVSRQRADWAPPKEPVSPEPARAPRTSPPARTQTPPVTPPRTAPQDKAKPAELPPARPERPATQPPKKPDLDEAKDYHRDKWQEPRRSNPPQTQPAPAPRTKPVTPAAPKRESAPRQEKPKQAPQTQKRREG